MSPPRIGLVGCGGWGKNILRDLLTLGCEVEVVTRSDGSRATAADLGASRVVSAIDQLDGPDGIVVATPMESHAENVREALVHDVPIYCEKPLTVDVADAEDICTRAADSLFLMHKWRYHPGVLALADLARRGDLGRIQGLTTERLQWGEGHGDTDVAWHLAPHDLSIGREILGSVGPLRHAAGHRLDGTLMEVTAVLGEQPWHALTISRVRHDRRRHVQVHGDDGIAWLGDGWATSVFVATRGGQEPTEIRVGDALPLLAQLRAFVEHLQGGPPPKSNATEGLEEVRRIEEIREAIVP